LTADWLVWEDRGSGKARGASALCQGIGHMEYRKFRELLRKGECETTDFKLECNAFQRNTADNAEFVKDIVAMANNGYVASYLVIGVSDDRKGFRSVANDNLTDENLQRLCRDSVTPTPAVKLTRESWPRAANRKHKGKTFVVIQVGPQPRQCFSISRDLVDWPHRCCHRKHEVWVRRGTTSDLATPQEIKRLLEGKVAIARPAAETSVDYTRLRQDEVESAILSDLSDLVHSAGGQLHGPTHFTNGRARRYLTGHRIMLPIEGSNLVLKLLVIDKCTSRAQMGRLQEAYLDVQHGLLLVCHGNVSPQSVVFLDQTLKEPWGWFCVSAPYSWIRREIALPRKSKGSYTLHRFSLALPRIRSSDALRRAWAGMVTSLKETPDITGVVARRRSGLRAALKVWLREGCPAESNRHYSYAGRLPKRIEGLRSNEFWAPARYGGRVMVKQPEEVRWVREYLKVI